MSNIEFLQKAAHIPKSKTYNDIIPIHHTHQNIKIIMFLHASMKSSHVSLHILQILLNKVCCSLAPHDHVSVYYVTTLFILVVVFFGYPAPNQDGSGENKHNIFFIIP